MNTFLSESLAQEHVAALDLEARSIERAREARLARRDARRAERRYQRAVRPAGRGHRGRGIHPLASARNWLVAGEL